MHSRTRKRAEQTKMGTQAKKKRQQRAQSRLALARHQQQERARRQAAAAQRAESQWPKTLRELAALGATLEEGGPSADGNANPGYVIPFEGSTHPCPNLLHPPPRLTRTRPP